MKVETLLSCVGQKDSSLIERENLSQAIVLMVNQTSESDEGLISVDDYHRIIHTHTKGLSISRNIAKENSIGDICIIADDDERFFDNTQDKVLLAYKENPKADIIIFKIKNLNKKYPKRKKYLKKIDIFRVSSVQITFRRRNVDDIFFDPRLGAGTENGAGEENKFLLDCLKKKKKILFIPEEIGELLPSESSWFKGYDESYFYKRGMTTRYTFGLFISVLYAFYYVIAKRKTFNAYISPSKALKSTLKGIKENKLKRCSK